MWHLSHISGQVVNVTSLQELSLTKLMHCFLSHCQLVPNNIYKIHLCGSPPNWWCACAALMSRRMSAHWKSSWAQPCPSDQLWRNFFSTFTFSIYKLALKMSKSGPCPSPSDQLWHSFSLYTIAFKINLRQNILWAHFGTQFRQLLLKKFSLSKLQKVSCLAKLQINGSENPRPSRNPFVGWWEVAQKANPTNWDD